MIREPVIKRWSARHKAELIVQIYRGKTTIPEAGRHYNQTRAEIERRVDDTEASMENALKANPKNIDKEYEKQLSELKKCLNRAGAGGTWSTRAQ